MDWLDQYLDALSDGTNVVYPPDTHIWKPAKPTKQQQALIQDSIVADMVRQRVIKEAREQEIEAGMGGGYDAGSAAKEGPAILPGVTPTPTPTLTPSPTPLLQFSAFDNFYVNVPATGGDGNYPQTSWINNAGVVPFDTGLVTPNTWSYAGGNFNGGPFPSQVGTYLSLGGGGLYPFTQGGQYAGPGASYLLGGSDFWIGYNDSYGSAGLPDAQSQIGKYTKEWYGGSPNYDNNPNGVNNKFLWLQGLNLASTTDGLAAMLLWTCPVNGTFRFTGSYINGDYVSSSKNATFAIVDSNNNVKLNRQIVSTRSQLSSFDFTSSYLANDIVQFQVGNNGIVAPERGTPFGLEVNIAQLS